MPRWRSWCRLLSETSSASISLGGKIGPLGRSPRPTRRRLWRTLKVLQGAGAFKGPPESCFQGARTFKGPPESLRPGCLPLSSPEFQGATRRRARGRLSRGHPSCRAAKKCLDSLPRPEQPSRTAFVASFHGAQAYRACPFARDHWCPDVSDVPIRSGPLVPKRIGQVNSLRPSVSRRIGRAHSLGTTGVQAYWACPFAQDHRQEPGRERQLAIASQVRAPRRALFRGAWRCLRERSMSGNPRHSSSSSDPSIWSRLPAPATFRCQSNAATTDVCSVSHPTSRSSTAPPA